MKRLLLLVCLTCIFTLLALPAHAQTWSEEQLEVWHVISKVWEMEKDGDDTWTDMLHASYQSWPYASPMPLNKEATVRLIGVERGQFKILSQHMFPVGIVIVGDTAVVHYFHTTVTEWKDGERETVDGRTTDVLARTKDGWRILGWVGDEIGEDDDD